MWRILPAIFASGCTISSVSLQIESVLHQQRSPHSSIPTLSPLFSILSAPDPNITSARSKDLLEDLIVSAKSDDIVLSRGSVPYVRVFKDKNGREIHFVGSCHVLKKSAEDAIKVIQKVKPDVVMVELDDRRARAILGGQVSSLNNPNAIMTTMSALYKAFEKRTNYRPGTEFREAMLQAHKIDARVVLGDRDSIVTTKRIGYSLMRNLPKLILSPSLNVDNAANMMEHLLPVIKESVKPGSYSTEKINEFLKQLAHSNFSHPALAGLVTERDEYMASHLRECGGNKVVAVVGIAHVDGIIKILDNNEQDNVNGAELRAKLSEVPSRLQVASLVSAYAALPLSLCTVFSLSLRRLILRRPASWLTVALHFSSFTALLVGGVYYTLNRSKKMQKEIDFDALFDSIENMEIKSIHKK